MDTKESVKVEGIFLLIRAREHYKHVLRSVEIIN